MVRDRGFEPLTPSVSRKCSTTELTAHAIRGGINSQIRTAWQAQKFAFAAFRESECWAALEWFERRVRTC